MKTPKITLQDCETCWITTKSGTTDTGFQYNITTLEFNNNDGELQLKIECEPAGGVNGKAIRIIQG